MRDIDDMAIKAKHDNNTLNQLINKYEFHILKSASLVTHRYISKNDDEWSIALLAFTQAIESYELDKGGFIKFSELIIRRRLIDYIRQQKKFTSEIFVDPLVFDTPSDEEDENIAIRNSVADKVAMKDNSDIKLEINAINQTLADYGFSFLDLTTCSPKAKKTKINCAKAINYMLENPDLINELHTTKQLPLKVIENNTVIPRKIMERHRKYIIAVLEILYGDFPNLAEYLHYVREEGKK